MVTRVYQFIAPSLVIFTLTLIGSLLFASCATPPSSTDRTAGSGYIRVNQVGYITNEIKQAILLATGSKSGVTFEVTNTQTNQSVYSATIGSSQGKWSDAFPNT